MANKIGSNFLLPAKAFLDSRQDIPLQVGDLRTWDYDKYPIPIGFEVFVEGKWYTYYGNTVTEDLITGYFRVRGGINVLQTTGTSESSVMSQAAVTNSLNSLNQRIQDIVSNIGTVLEIRVIEDTSEIFKELSDKDPGGLYKEGSSVRPAFAWEVWYNGKKLETTDEKISRPVVYINGALSDRKPEAIKDLDGGVHSYIWIWTQGEEIKKDTTYTIKVSYDSEADGAIGSIEVSTDIVYKFVKAKIWGKATNVKETLSTLLSGFEELSDSRFLSLNNIDFSKLNDGTFYDSGLYFYYLIPNELYGNNEIISNPIKVKVGDIEISSYTTVTDQGGYTLIMFDWAQTGILNIEFI